MSSGEGQLARDADVGEGAEPVPGSVLVVGAGLLGASVGLALRRRGVAVRLTDADERAEALAADLGAGERGLPVEAPDVVLVAVPPASIVQAALDMHHLYPNATISDVGSVKTQLLVDVEARTQLRDRFVGGHPLAGRERSGPGAAQADLFEGRPWVLTPGPHATHDRVAVVRGMVRATGAIPVVQSAETHDASVALVSHLPQVVSSLLAGRLVEAPLEALALSGSGLRDTTRVAASDPDLWTQILRANAGPVAELLDRVATDVDRMRTLLRALAGQQRPAEESTSREDDEAVDRPSAGAALEGLRLLLETGRAGQARIPGKHGGRPVTYAVLPVVIPDEPGALARLFAAAGDAGVNIEDVTIEHSPGQPVGLVELAVAPERVQELAGALRTRGWQVH